ncbi:hypothetical protein B0H66DRAFT_17472 [Apodospora peruviana]|uniref:Rhodopsin domain-containing protein n=1 Tax=Apodospora peruviana TaxID=516989 RepID=A0AAE0MEA3_9PEZI|nr:hypothetical protein B0H66DRAFT_17472 [Apodospora peruviana]
MFAATTDTQSEGVVITDDNLNPILQIITWLLLALTSLMMCFRTVTRCFLRKHDLLAGWDDNLLLLSYIVGVGEMVIWILPHSTIFGRTIGHISQDEMVSGLKAMYASDILFLLSLGFAKLSVCACYVSLIPANDMFHRRWSLAMASVVTLWTIAFSFAAAFRCGIRPWWNHTHDDSITCLDQSAFLQGVSITNILTDAGLVAIPISLFAPLKLPLRTRLTSVLIFSARALIIIPCAFQLAYMPNLANMDATETDWTLQGFPYFVTTQVVEFAGISAACIIYLSPFLQSLGSGAMKAESLPSFTPKQKQSTQHLVSSDSSR